MKELSPPPSNEVHWTFRIKSECLPLPGVNQYECIVSAQTWFVARQHAAVLLKIAPEYLEYVK